jgi:hypothetical protein
MHVCSSTRRPPPLLAEAASSGRSAREAPAPITATSTSVPTTPNITMVSKFCGAQGECV